MAAARAAGSLGQRQAGLPVFETDAPDPLYACARAASHTLPAPQIQPRLSESFRLTGMLVAKDS